MNDAFLDRFRPEGIDWNPNDEDSPNYPSRRENHTRDRVLLATWQWLVAVLVGAARQRLFRFEHCFLQRTWATMAKRNSLVEFWAWKCLITNADWVQWYFSVQHHGCQISIFGEVYPARFGSFWDQVHLWHRTAMESIVVVPKTNAVSGPGLLISLPCHSRVAFDSSNRRNHDGKSSIRWSVRF